MDQISLGYYTVGGVAYYNRYVAMEEALRLGKSIHFHLDDDFWIKQQWKTPVNTTLDNLYRIRAEKIRAKYDYVVLMYSGGADSWNILKAFDKAGIKLDEILCWHNKGILPEEHPMHSEVFQVAIPSARDFVTRHPETRLTIVDAADALPDLLAEWDHDKMMESFYVCVPSFNNIFRLGYLGAVHPTATKLAEKGKKVGVIVGAEKTVVRVSGPKTNRKYAFAFNEFIACYRRTFHFWRKAPVELECFYWTPDMPELVIKQAHILKRLCESLPRDWQDTSPDKRTKKNGRIMVDKQRHAISHLTVDNWLYGWDVNTFSEQKSGGLRFLISWDVYVLDKLQEDIIRKWRTAMEKSYNLHKAITQDNRNISTPLWGVSCPIMNTRHYELE